MERFGIGHMKGVRYVTLRPALTSYKSIGLTSAQQLVSSRQLTSFSDFRFSDDCPDFVSTADYCTYLEEYCTHFNLWPHIKLSTQVGKIRRNEKGGHIISFSKKGTEGEEQWHCDAIAVCSGLHVTPNIPSLKGIENVPESMHSSDFKECKQFGINKNIMVLGAGETVMDIAYLAVTSPTKSVTICYRVGFKNTPKVRDSATCPLASANRT